MGNFHCVSSSCATVVYREYLPPVVRWQYPGEEWQEIEGDDYAVNPKILGEEIIASEFNKAYQIYGSIRVNGRMPPDPNKGLIYLDGQEIKVRIGVAHSFSAPIFNDFSLAEGYSNVYLNVTYLVRSGNHPITRPCIKITQAWQIYRFSGTSTIGTVKRGLSNDVTPGFKEEFGFYDIELVETPNFTVLPCSNNLSEQCIFKVFKNGAVVHEETRADCPEVEVLPCRLDDKFKQIKIDKLPFLDRVEVVNKNYDFTVNPDNDLNYDINVSPAPANCLNVYKSPTVAPVDIQIETFDINLVSRYEFIKQICSASDCPPPEYDVVCECQPCESCPDGTCPIECGGVMCCYGSDGIAVKSIPIENYCNE